MPRHATNSIQPCEIGSYTGGFQQFVDPWGEDGEVIVSRSDCHTDRRLSDSDLSM